ncbi:STX17 family protein [Megaselia abdita]
MEEKLPMKRVQLSAKKFNEVAVPYNLGLLKNHKSQIEKSLALGDWSKVKQEEINASRIVKQMKNLMLEMDVLREKVRDEDLDKFDELISIGKENAMLGMKEYLKLQLKSPVSMKSSDSYSDPIIMKTKDEFDDGASFGLVQIQTDYNSLEHQLETRKACLQEFENLQREVEDLHSTFKTVSELVHDQSESVDAVADNAEEALENAQVAESQLRRALTYKKAMYPIVGALVGTCMGGPIGLLVGAKAGGVAAVGCGILGFTGGSVLKANNGATEGIQGAYEEEKLD